uniref:Mitochondrial ribosomal protein L1 n=1 Tax=Cynoglossus semilaevis TaxID=244447 RepID=A0A3P8W351_CYNSE
MATGTRAVWKVLSRCQQHLLSVAAPANSGISQNAWRNVPVRTVAAVKTRAKKVSKEEAEKEIKKEKVINETKRHKPYDAIELLKKFQKLDFTSHSQPVYVNLKLDMKLEKKRKVDAFVATLQLPFPFKTDLNKILVFTEDPNQMKEALENGASMAGGAELIQQIIDDEISADFYLAVPAVVPKIMALKSKLRKKFPKSNRGTVGDNIISMLDMYKTGFQYKVENQCYINTQIATLDMPTEHIFTNLQTILIDVCSRKPAEMGPFIERAIIGSQTSEALWFKSEDVLPKDEEKKEEEQ